MRRTIDQPRYLFGICLLATVLLAGCGGLRIGRTILPARAGWTTFGGGPQRTSVAQTPVVPPLTRRWTESISAGVGTGSPVTVDSIVLIGNLRGELHAILGTTGKEIGWVRLGDAIQGSPTTFGSTVYVTASHSDESVLAFDLSSGKTLWAVNCGDVEVSPLLLGNRLYIGNSTGTFFCLDRTTGRTLWTYPLPENSHRKGIRSNPAGNDSTVVFGADDGFFYALDAATGKLRWREKGRAGIVAPPLIAHEMVFVGDLDSTMHAFDLATGAVRWQARTGAALYAGAALADSLLLVGTLGGDVLALRITDGTTAWRTAVSGPVNAAGVVSGGFFYSGTLTKVLFALRVSDGTLVWKEEVGGRVKTSPAIAGQHLIIATDEREVMAFEGAK